MDMTIQILPAGPAYPPVMAAIHKAAFARDEVWDTAYIAGLLGLPNVFGFFSPTGGMVLARSAADEAEVLTIGVIPEARNRGLGRALLDAVLAESARRGARMLLLEVASTNTPALALYLARGGVQVGERRRYYADGRDALILALPIPQPPAAQEENHDQ
jgi:ribosomal-protein-alanine N-acetyltransferase